MVRTIPMRDPDDRRDPDRQLFRQLYDEMRQFGGRFDGLSEKIEEVRVLASRIENHSAEIGRLRDSMEENHDRITRLEAYHQARDAESGSLVLKPAVLTLVLAVLGILVTGFWEVIKWIRDLDRP